VPAEAEAQHPDPLRALGPQAAHRRAHVRDRARARQLPDELEAPLTLLVGELDARRDAVVEVRRDRDVTEPGEAIGDVADVGAHAEHLHRDDDAR
jgi:hypothetical protein